MTRTSRSIRPSILALALALAAACGSSREERQKAPAPETTAAPAAPSQADPFAPARGVAIDRGAAQVLPDDTAGAFTIADLPHLVTQLGLGVTQSDLVQALRAELARVIGFDLLDPAAAAAAGVRTDAPVTLAWLDHDASELALVVAVADEGKLRAALSGRPLLIRGQRALIPLGARSQRTLQQLTDSPRSLADSGRLAVMDRVQFGTDAALYLGQSASPALAGAGGMGVGFSVRDDAVLLRAVTLFEDAVPTPGTFAKVAAHALGATDIYAKPDFQHPLLASLLTGGPALSFAPGDPLDHLVPRLTPLADADPSLTSEEVAQLDQQIRALEAHHLPAVGDARTRLLDGLGLTALRAGRIDHGLAYYGAQVFRGAKTTEVVARAIALWRARTQSADATALAALEQKRAVAMAKAGANAGILAALKDSGQGAFATITGSALDDAGVYGGLLGDSVGDMNGGGFGTAGTGGGGTGWGTIGTGHYGTIGHGSGGGSSGYGTGAGRGGMRGRYQPPQLRIGSSTVKGDLDKNIIRRYVRRKLSHIKYCYEKQLLADPSLAGTVRVKFVIDSAGRVATASATGISKQVDSCIAGVFQAMRFPKPKGGGVVSVVYPFTFKSS